jgi:hypothetical protein
LLESIELFLDHLDVYTRMPPTPAMDEIVAKIIVELLSILALATKRLKQGQPSMSVPAYVLLYFTQYNAVKDLKKRFGEMDVEVILQRLVQPTLDEARVTTAETLDVVYGLIQNMRLVMDGEQTYLTRVTYCLLNNFPSRRRYICWWRRGSPRYVLLVDRSQFYV